MTPDKSSANTGSDQYRAGKIVGSFIAALLALYGVSEWWEFVSSTADGYAASGMNGQLIFYLFCLWFLPSAVASAIMIFVFGWRSIVARVVLVVFLLLFGTTVVTAIVGAQ